MTLPFADYLWKRKYLVVLVVILCVAAFLRLWRISDYMTFLGDEGRDVLIVKRMIVDGKFTLLGPTASVGGFFMGPAYYYLMAPFLFLWRLDPAGPAVMVALFGVVTVGLLYFVASEMFSKPVGLFASLLYAVSPLVIAYSRSSWNPNLVPFFSLLFMYLIWRRVVYKDSRAMLFAGITAGVGLQHHYVFLFLFPAFGLFLLRFLRGSSLLKAILSGVGGFLIGFSPFLLFELRHGFPNSIAISRFLARGDETGFVFSNFYTNIVDVVFRAFGRLVFRFPEEGQFYRYEDWQISMWESGVWLAIVFSVAVLIISLIWRKSVFRKIFEKDISKTIKVRSETIWMLMLWLSVGMGMFGLYQRGIYDYYFGIFFALPFILVSLLFALGWRVVWLRPAVVIIGILLVYLNVRGHPFQFEPNRQLAQTERIAKSAYDKTSGQPFNFALVTATNSDHGYRYFFELWGNHPVTIENDVLDPQRDTVTDQLIVICENTTCEPLGHPLWEIAGFGPAVIEQEWDEPPVKIFRLIHQEETDEN